MGVTKKWNRFGSIFLLLLPRASISNSHARHGVVVPAWDTVAVKATLKPSMGVAPLGQTLKKRALRLFFLLFPSKQLQSNGHAQCRKVTPRGLRSRSDCN